MEERIIADAFEIREKAIQEGIANIVFMLEKSDLTKSEEAI